MGNTTKRRYTKPRRVTEPCPACGHVFERPASASKFCRREECSRPCDHCGCDIPHKVSKGTGLKRYCSRACSRKANPPAPPAYFPRSTIHIFNCRYCDVLFVSRNIRWTRCNSEACTKAFNTERSREFSNRWKAANGTSYTSHWNRKNPDRAQEMKNVYRVECGICGNVYMSSKPRARYCAGVCSDIAKSNAWNNPRHRAKRQLKKAAKGTKGRGRFTQGPCHQCGTPFMARPGQNGSRYCSPQCAERARSLRRNALERGAPGIAPGTMARWQVYERHDFTCWLCELPLNMEAHYLEDDAPTIDHVLALAAGGTHDDENLRPAHRWCNAVKGDRDTW
jgi:hypothetical protein